MCEERKGKEGKIGKVGKEGRKEGREGRKKGRREEKFSCTFTDFLVDSCARPSHMGRHYAECMCDCDCIELYK